MQKALEGYIDAFDADKEGRIDLTQVAQVVEKLSRKMGKEPKASLIEYPKKAKGGPKISKKEALSLMMKQIPESISSLKPEEAVKKIEEQTAEVKKLLSKRFARRDKLIDIEKRTQEMWESKKINEMPVDEKKPKFFCTFPYPYMNGKLHLGHAFTLCKAEFAARFQRLLGKQVLYPFGFHCTGMPIAACAEKLAKEIKTYGNPPQFPADEPASQPKEEPKDTKEGKKGKKKGKKGKAAKKKSKKKFQWQILEEMGVPKNLVSQFADSRYWLDYFPPIAIVDLKKLGVMVDWRRSFITTDANPYYDAFVRWQFNRLMAAKKVELAKRMCVFSPSNGQPCADHDRSEGEGIGPQEYTLIKIKILKPYPSALATALGDKKEQDVFLAAATLRPETMYGQTNCWILPSGEYKLVEMNSGETFVVSERSALNMSFQELSGTPNKPKIFGTVKGTDLLGLPLSAPLCKYEKVYTLPLLTISMGKGTGVVTSVPSDAPADYAAYMDMKKDAGMRKKYGITEDMIKFDIVPIINTPLEGASPDDQKLPAPYLCKKLKIKNQRAVDKLETAKKECYKISNAKGTMLVGEAKGMGVTEAKEKVKKMMIGNAQAVTYYEPQEKVVARSGNEECVCALTEQWFLKYGEGSPEWQKEVAGHIASTLDCYNPKAKAMFEFTIGWLKQWACSRTAGLGTKLPWDKEFLIESLSDSTVYMSYYTIAHYFQGGHLDGGKPSKSDKRIMPEDLTDEFFNYVFADPKDKVQAPSSAIPKETLENMRREFLYWYPMDLRVSGKDLIRNHLTMSLYNHAAIWKDPSMWPRSFYTNGHVMINSEKMSKSTGNFMTLEQACNQYGTDATRLALADAGDGLEDSNFAEDTADRSILKLTTLDEWVDEMIASESKLRSGEYNFFDSAFDNEINAIAENSRASYSEMRFRDAIKDVFYGMLNARDFYRAYVPGALHVDLVKKFIKCQCILLAPICPHFCQHLWDKASSFIGSSGFVVDATYPTDLKSNPLLTAKTDYLRTLGNTIRSTLGRGKIKVKPNVLKLTVSKVFPEWKRIVVDILKSSLAKDGEMCDNKSLSVELRKKTLFHKNKKLSKNAMSYAAMLKSQFQKDGPKVLNTDILFDEVEVLNASIEFLKTEMPYDKVVIDLWNDSMKKINPEPGKPAITFLEK